MSTSNRLKLLVKREDTGKVHRIEIEEGKQIFDLLEASKTPLNFEEDAILCVYRQGDKEQEAISEAFYLREMENPDKVVLIIRDKRIEEREKQKEKDEARDKENMEKAKKMKENIDKKLEKREKVNNNHDEFRKEFSEQGPSSSQAKHKLLDDLKQQTTKSDNTAEISSTAASEEEEIRILTRKINSEGLEGFIYEIIPESYTDYDESGYYERSFSSEEERKSSHSKVSSTKSWLSWEAESGFSGWGVSVSASAGGDNSAGGKEGEKTKAKEKTCIAVVTKTSFHQMKKFRVSVKIDDKAIKDAKDILYASMFRKQQVIDEFNNKYCSFVYSGQFTAGGWFRIVSTAKSSEAMEFSALEREATHKTEFHSSAAFSGYGVTAGGGVNLGSSSQINTHGSQERRNSSVQVLIRKESAPGNISSEAELETKIKDVKKCSIFPVIDAKKSHFIPIYDIIQSQAETDGDKALTQVARILRLHRKGESTLMSSCRRPFQPYVLLLGDVGTGKSTIVEKMTGESSRNSDSSVSDDKRSLKILRVPDGSLTIVDTLGMNALGDTFESHSWITSAVNSMHISKIFVVVKAEASIVNVISNVRKYADSFVRHSADVMAVLVTHMDMPYVKWKEEFAHKLRNTVGIGTVVFCAKDATGETLVWDILNTCTEEHYFNVDSENFSKILTILKSISNEVTSFREKKNAFDKARKAFNGKDLVDVVFEFHAYMTEEIVKSRMRMIDANNFTLNGDDSDVEEAHVANMANQLRAMLGDVRTECSKYQNEHGHSEFRRCPHCGEIWTRECVDGTGCGRWRGDVNDVRWDSSYSVLATFTFKWVGNKFSITKNNNEKGDNCGGGCGKSIQWRYMSPVDAVEYLQQKRLVMDREREIGRVLQLMAAAQAVDLCFLVDCTGSMSSYIQGVKEKIKTIVEKSKRMLPDLNFSVAFVGYRDHCDGAGRIVVLDFTTSILEFQSFMGTVTATGGGDAPEDVFGGIEEVTKLSWSKQTRILFHIADSPCHGTRFHDPSVGDEYPNGDPRGLRIEDLLSKLEELKIIYWFAKLGSATDLMVQVFQSIMKINQIDLASVDDLVGAVAGSIAASVNIHEENIGDEVVRDGMRGEVEYKLDPHMPDWSLQENKRVTIWKNKIPRDLDNFRKPLKVYSDSERFIKIAADPFAEGKLRIAYRGKYADDEKGSSLVLKLFKYTSENQFDRYKEQMEIQSVAVALANKFNTIKPAGTRDVHFVDVSTVAFTEGEKKFHFAMERYIAGKYIKFNNNAGFVNEAAYTATLNAFSHWTYWATGKYLMVVDLQGVKEESSGEVRYVLTDPAIHCGSLRRFGKTNLGREGMYKFFRTHYCNGVCRAMSLKFHRFQPTEVYTDFTGATVVA